MNRPEWTTAADGTPVLHIYTDEQADAYVRDAMTDKPNWALWLLLGFALALVLRKK